jgi:hypothetical protein
MSLPKFPQELVDEIIDHLYDDKAALKCCALVSKLWLHRSRTHIWSVKRYEFYKPDMKALSDFLVSNPHIPPYITQLQVNHVHNLRFLLSFSPLLHNMTTLMLEQINPFPTKLPIESLSLQTLQLYGVYFQRVIDAIRFISSFPNISGLLLIVVTFAGDSYQVEELQHLPSIRNVRRLHLNNRHGMTLAPVFASSPCGAYLETLDVWSYSPQCETSFLRLLSVAKNSLNSLTVELDYLQQFSSMFFLVWLINF